MLDFYCNKRFDISFTDLHKLIKLVLPTNYTSEELRGIYRRDYMPCNIISLKNKDTSDTYNIYCWLGKNGLTVLADTEIAVSIVTEVLKEVKQNAEDYKMLTFDIVDENELINLLKEDYLIYKQMNSSENTSKYVIREYNNDEILLEFFYNPDFIRLSGAQTSLLTYVQLSINKLLSN